MSRGFTLVEVVVAVVIFEVGVLGVVGTLLLASRVATRAEAIERAVATAEGVMDSLLVAGNAAGTGERVIDGGRLIWRVDAEGWITLDWSPLRGRPFSLNTRALPPVTPDA
jgi:Tfp pilus assembly protein PilV